MPFRKLHSFGRRIEPDLHDHEERNNGTVYIVLRISEISSDTASIRSLL